MIFVAVLSGCATISADRTAETAGFEKSLIRTSPFTLVSYCRFNSPGRPLSVYIEGDGRAWLSRSRLSDDPTPRKPLVLNLAAMDPSPNVAYLARPCQYLTDEPCEPAYWSDRRFSEEVIASMNEALDALVRESGAKEVHLIGYSGGAAVAALIAARRSDVKSLRTIAGNLDPVAVNRRHGAGPLKGSLNPADAAAKLEALPQRHFTGARDEVVPPEALESFLSRMGCMRCVSLTRLEGVDHHRGWEERWPALLDMPVDCREQWAMMSGPERGLFVTQLQEPRVLSSREAVAGLVDFAKKSDVRTLYVQVYRGGVLETGELDFLIQSAHGADMEVYAWLNLLSLSANPSAPILKKYGPDILARNREPKASIEDYRVDNQYFLEPGDPRVVRELVSVVEEVVRSYPGLDGLLFDYVRYCDRNPDYGYSKANVERFKKATRRQAAEKDDVAWKNWKRLQVTELLKELRQRARRSRPGIPVLVTGLMPFARAYHEGFQDWRHWQEKDLADGVLAMCYTLEEDRFGRLLEDAREKAWDWSRVGVGVGAYALLDKPEVFIRQWEACEASGARSCVALHYGSLLERDFSEAGFQSSSASPSADA